MAGPFWGEDSPADEAVIAANVATVQVGDELAAVVHGEWVRIHPYANGNGRIAGTWANWVATRYGCHRSSASSQAGTGCCIGRPPTAAWDCRPTS